ncbi:hypothetical protein CC78DRAFT_537790 [Lojkania enalia]|uniref:Heterokaryon incompatibility domain-containing protein n=1 Tax=Lojkania enalia TaxID=147567 RepID=A0A9P4MYD1_9PLEO|nr:hypothetical protein CC78DRAFT_537790 [Didymosphaeria enalia]
MENDLQLTFGQIFNNNLDALHSQLLEIQHIQANRLDSEKWVQRLRFLDISCLPDLADNSSLRAHKVRRGRSHNSVRARPTYHLTIPLTSRTSIHQNTEYVAVSWPWGAAKEPHAPSRFTFDVQRRSSRVPHKSEFPDHFMERVLRFAQFVKIDYIWVDKESIYQDNSRDKDLGVQIMDVVYGYSTSAAGLLTTQIEHQHDIDALSALLSREIFVHPGDTQNPQFNLHEGHKTLIAIEKVVERILADKWWERAWIFQEDHLASDRMVLLVPHSADIDKSGHHGFGNIEGELLIKLPEFKQAVTLFCIAARPNKIYIEQWMRKAKQYNIWNKRIYRTTPPAPQTSSSTTQTISSYPTTTLSILEGICHRDIAKEEDRIAILANAAKFSTRIDISPSSQLLSSPHSLSAALLTLILLNGEILKDSCKPSMPQGDILNHTLLSYLKACQAQLIAPSSHFSQTYIDHCRFNAPLITRAGLLVPGFLFRLLSPIPSLTPFTLPVEKRWALRLDDQHARGKLSSGQYNAIVLLIIHLKAFYRPNLPFARFLTTQLSQSAYRKHPQTAPCVQYIRKNLSALAAALMNGTPVQLARLENSSPSFSFSNEDDNKEGEEEGEPEPSAIFILPPQSSSHVFTAWDNGLQGQGMERLASLQVRMCRQPVDSSSSSSSSGSQTSLFSSKDADSSSDSNLDIEADAVFLRCRGWVNGVWCVRGKRVRKCVVAVPGLSDMDDFDEGE